MASKYNMSAVTNQFYILSVVAVLLSLPAYGSEETSQCHSHDG